MQVLVTGSSGHLGEGIVRTLRARGDGVVAVDVRASEFTTHVVSVCDFALLRSLMRDVEVVIHAAGLHKRHLATHAPHRFVETNVAGTLAVLEAALAERVSAVVFTSTTSVYGGAMKPGAGEHAIWVDEGLPCVPKNIYGASKKAAEDLCELYARSKGLACVVLRVGRFYPEAEPPDSLDDAANDLNHKVNDYLYRRVDLEDAVTAHLLAAEHAHRLGFGRYIVSGSSPFHRYDLPLLRNNAAAVVTKLFPGCSDLYGHRGWSLPSGIDRVYSNARARDELGWAPRLDFLELLERLRRGGELFSALARDVGSKGYALPDGGRNHRVGPDDNQPKVD